MVTDAKNNDVADSAIKAASKAKAAIANRQPIQTSPSPMIRQLISLRNDLVRMSPALFAHEWLKKKFARLDAAIAKMQERRLVLAVDISDHEDAYTVIAEMFNGDFVIGTPNASDETDIEIKSTHCKIRVAIRRPSETSPSNNNIPIDIRIKAPSSRYPSQLGKCNNRLATVLELRDHVGDIKMNRSAAAILFATISQNEKKCIEAVSALKGLKILNLVKNIIDNSYPSYNVNPLSGQEDFANNPDNFCIRREMFETDFEEFFRKIESRFEYILESSSLSIGRFYLAIDAEVNQKITIQAFEQQPEKSIASELGFAVFAKYLYKEKMKIRVKNSSISSINKVVQEIVQKEIKGENRYLLKQFQGIQKSAQQYNIGSAVFGLTLISDTALSGSNPNSLEVKRHLTSAMKAVAASFEIDYEFKGILGRLIEARMAMLSTMMMIFLIGRAVALEYDTSILYRYMLGGIAIFAIISTIIGPFAQRIERERANLRLKKTLSERLSAAAERAYVLSIRDLKSAAESRRVAIQRNLKALDELHKSDDSDRTRQAAISAIARAKSDAIATQGEKFRSTVEKLRGDLAVQFADAAATDQV
ncbi:MAG: hypothetical protein GYB33_09660 [Gammaproteobacteria bacterium]|nr:hypothetical protein [Gammaproteobacteria bacterium]